MKRTAAIAGMLFLAALGLAAAVWDGSAVAGVAGDFPDDGFYGACNSFPRDTSVTVTNLENGKVVTVVITRNVDNPGVFIALSPKAAAELGMRAGSASRIRAVALVASQAETSLPPTRAGESSDPDYNPKVYVEREKAAVAAAAASSTAATMASPAASAAVPEAAVAASPRPTLSAAAKPASPESAEVLAKVAAPAKQPAPALPSLTEPKPVAAAAAGTAAPPAKASPAVAAAIPTPAVTPAVKPAVAAKTASPKVPADALPLPETSPAFPGSPRPLPYGMSLPSPDAPAIPSAATPIAHGGYLAQAPEVLGDTKPSPRKAVPPRLVIADPALPSAAAPPAKAAVKAPGKASVTALARPKSSGRSTAAPKLALAEPNLEFAPEELPVAILNRITAPTKLIPNPVLAEAPAPKDAGGVKKGPEAIAFEKPSYAEAVETAALPDSSPPYPAEAYSAYRPGKTGSDGTVVQLAEADLPGSPEALYSARPDKTAGADSDVALEEAAVPGSPEALAGRKVAGAAGGLAELQSPDVPYPTEGIGAEWPRRAQSGAVAADLDEPGVSSPVATGLGPTAIADARKGPGSPPDAALSDPAIPTPTETLTAGNPNAVAPGQAVAELAEPNSTRSDAATAVAAEKPGRVAASGSPDLASPAVPSPTESIAAEHPAVVSGAERAVTLEPAAPRPPVTATSTPVPAVAGPVVIQAPKPEAPASVATIKGPSPAGAAQAPTSVPMLKGLAKGSFYVQIGVYGTNDALQMAVAGFKSTAYPLAVEKLTTKAGAAAYRLFVGPLSRDESGVVLIKIRSLGHKDAYVRQGS